tara:strand:+ start:160 stop:720 length:561 start_codon:yes stop_codon:yes gene_type:complete
MVQYARPDDTLSTDTGSSGTNWTDQASGANLHLAIDEASADDATTHIKVSDDGTEVGCLVRLGDVSAPGSSGTYIKYKALTEDEEESGQPGLKLELLEDGAVLDPAVTVTNNSVSTSSWTDYTYTISDVSGISDWNDLSLRISMLPSAGMGDDMKVTQAYLEVPDASGGSDAVPVSLNTYRQMREH